MAFTNECFYFLLLLSFLFVSLNAVLIFSLLMSVQCLSALLFLHVFASILIETTSLRLPRVLLFFSVIIFLFVS